MTYRITLQFALTCMFLVFAVLHTTVLAEPGPATEETKAENTKVLKELPFENKQDFENAKKGFIATIDEGVIKDEDGNIVYSMKQYDFIKGESPDTVNPSLWRQSELNSINGLFEVVDGIYQIRGFDLANMSIIKGDTGWIIIDPLTSAPTAKAALDLVNKNLGERPVVAVIHTHSHVDHFGGIRGVVDEEDVKSGKVKIVAPEDFVDHSVSENVIAGNTMSRRASYMYGNLLNKDETGNVGGGLGQTTSTGEIGLINPSDIIDKTGQQMSIDGVDIIYQMTPGAEAPSEMMFYFPQFKAFMQAEEINHTLHNLYTLRGAQVRNGLLWSKYINEAIENHGDEVEVSFGSHHWPTWGNEEVVDFWKKQRDLYKYIHDQTLNLANKGYTMIEIAEMIELPDELSNTFANRGYYGTVNHDVKAQYQLYFGWFDGNPANLHALPPAEAAKKYVEFMGGSDAVLKKAKESYDKGEYRWVGMVLNHLVFAEPNNQEARNLLALAYDQMGYQAESGPWRNFYLSGAKELREGVKELPTPDTASPDIIKNLSLELYFDFLGVRLNGPKAAELEYVFNVEFPDINEKAALYLDNGVLNYTIGKQEENADASVKITRAALDEINLGRAKFTEKVESGEASVEGNKEAWQNFLATIDTFPFWFNIVTP